MALFEAQPDLSVPLYADLTGEVAGVNGYNTGGLPINGTFLPTINGGGAGTPAIEAALWPTAWVLGNPYNLGDVVKSTAAPGYLYRCIIPGNGTNGAPAETLIGKMDETSGFVAGAITGAVFECMSRSITIFSSQPIVWVASGGGSASIGPAQHALIYNATTGLNAVRVDDDSPLTAPNGTPFTVSPDPVMGWAAEVPQ